MNESLAYHCKSTHFEMSRCEKPPAGEYVTLQRRLTQFTVKCSGSNVAWFYVIFIDSDIIIKARKWSKRKDKKLFFNFCCIPCNVLLSSLLYDSADLTRPHLHTHQPNWASFRIRKKQIHRGSADQHRYGSNIYVYPTGHASWRCDIAMRSLANREWSGWCVHGFCDGKRPRQFSS